MNIHQVSATYVQEQDRILVRINTPQGDEMRLWFTRRLCLSLWPTLERAVLATSELATRQDSSTPQPQAPMTQRLVGSFKRAAALQNADFTTPYESNAAARLPLGTEPLLVSEIRLTPQTDGALRIEFQENLAGMAAPRGFQVELVGTLMHGFVHLLERAIEQSQWWQRPDFITSAAAAQTERPSEAEPPRYLN